MRKLIFAIAALLALPGIGHAQQYGSDQDFRQTITTGTSAYSSGNALGGWQTIPVFRQASPSGILNYFWMMSATGKTPTVTVYILKAAPSSSSTCSDNQAFSLAAADRLNLAIPPFSVTLATSGTGDTATYGSNTNLAIELSNRDVPQTQNVYVCDVAGSSVTPGSTTDFTEVLGVSQN